jgi:hypothetical protein
MDNRQRGLRKRAALPPKGTVMLFETLAEAKTAKALIDNTACGGRCSRQHEIVNLDRPRAQMPL